MTKVIGEGGEVELFLDHVKATVQDATIETLKQLAFSIEGAAKVQATENEQVDTGFMRNAIYTVFEDGSNYDERVAAALKQVIDPTVERDAAPEVSLSGSPYPDTFAAVVAGANYSIYQEAIKSFLYAGANRAAPSFGATIEEVFKERLNDNQD